MVSITTAWLTLFKRGSLHMTQPAFVSFLHESPEDPKIFLRAMLYTTGKSGHIIEGMYVKINHQERVKTFNFWSYGETGGLMIGSGLRVRDDGVSHNHHFVQQKGGVPFEFLAGDYIIDVFATVINGRNPTLVRSIRLSVSPEHAQILQDKTKGLQFTWDYENNCYHSHIAEAPKPPYALPSEAVMPPIKKIIK
jgi:hypothetical protein